ncbi:hypothetical protein GGI42DRAFT_357402 [Trichoderma sp. SZMC 28013]
MDTATQFWDKVSTSLKSPYDQLDEDDEKHDLDETDFQDGNQRSGRRWKIFIGAGISAVCLALIVLVGYLVKGTRPSEYPCGQNLEEAQSRGCRFDQITWSWIPPHCPVYLSNEYLNATPGQPWLWYVEPYKKIVAREDDWPSIFNNEIRVYGERREHHAHCVYMFLNLMKVYESRGKHTQIQTDAEHMEHCGRLLMKLVEDDPLGTHIGTKNGNVHYNQNC